MRLQALSWLLLAASVAAEVAGTIALRYADGLTRPVPSVVVGASYAAAIWLMSIAVKTLEVGLAYAVWAGAGTASTAALGILWFGESMAPLRMIGIVMIVVGVVVLNLDPHGS
jgi:small multidrug resistance pump